MSENQDFPPSPHPLDEDLLYQTESDSKDSSPSHKNRYELKALLALGLGLPLCFFFFFLYLFSEEQLLTLQFSASYKELYLIVGLSLSYLGWKQLRNL